MNRITKLVEELLLLTKDKVNIQALEFEEVNINEEIRSRIKSLNNYILIINLKRIYQRNH